MPVDCLPTMKRIEAKLIIALMLIGALSLWTVIPLAWTWIGSQIAATQQPEFGVYVLVFFGTGISLLIVVRILAALNRTLAELTGNADRSRIPLPWVRSMRDEQHPHRTTPLDVVLLASVALAIVAAAIWFVGFAGSPLAGP